MFVKKSLYELAIDSEKNDNEQTNYGKNDITDKANENQNIENSIKLNESKTDALLKHKDDTNNYVLGKPSKEDKEKITKSINFSISNCDEFFDIDFSKLMNVLNGENS